MSSLKAILDQAIRDANQAVISDRAGAYEEAMELYKKSCGKLIHVVKYEKSDAVKTTLQGRLMGYLNRAEELKATLEVGSKPPASASNPNPPPGAAAEEDSEDNEPFDLHAELAKRVGLPEVKRQVLSLEHTLKIDKRRMETNPGYAPAGLHMHMLFRGPPGCGKTTMARLIAKSMKTLGVLKKGHLVEVQRSDLVAGHIGQTATKTRAVVESARGGVLFIDECYRLSPADAERDFGKEAIDELMMPMETGDPLIIFAGYDDPQMDAFVGSNPGLFRRINHSFVFEAYSTSELGEILLHKVEASGFSTALAISDAPALGALLEAHTSEEQRERMNGGMCDHILRQAKRALDARLTEDSSPDTLMCFELEDFVSGCLALPGAPAVGP